MGQFGILMRGIFRQITHINVQFNALPQIVEESSWWLITLLDGISYPLNSFEFPNKLMTPTMKYMFDLL